ncbi:hypothetical protein G5V59_15655 [Nocardioides sp. W3-2-3]|nr:hypothetical protein [Nocardioides convexus]
MRSGGSSSLTNQGTVTLTGLAVSDPLAGAVTCSPGTVAPGASVVCTADNPYVITQADVEAGSVDNIATAKGEGPKGDPDDPKDDVTTPPDTTTTPVVQKPALLLDKRVASVTDLNGNHRTDLGDEIRWEFESTNTGNVTLTHLAVSDPLAGPVSLCNDDPRAWRLDHLHGRRGLRDHAGRCRWRLGRQRRDRQG